MCRDDLVTIALYGSRQEASIAKCALDAENIQTYLIGAETTNTVWYVDVALDGVKLRVSQWDVDKATQVLAAILSTGETIAIGLWKCPQCGADVDSGFESCWSCNAPYDEQSAGAANFSAPGHLTNDPGIDGNADSSCSADDMAARAWLAAFNGIFFFPLLAYSFFLIVKLSRQELSPAATRQFYGALAIVFTMFILFWGALQLIRAHPGGQIALP